VREAYGTAGDWFADDYLFRVVPDEYRRDLATLYEDVLRMLSSMVSEGGAELPCGELLRYALVLAQARYYLGGRGTDAQGPLGEAVLALLDSDPGKPSVPRLVDLMNRLLEALRDRRRVRTINEQGRDYLDIVQAGSGTRRADCGLPHVP